MQQEDMGTAKLKIKSPEDFWSGLMFIAIGVAAVCIAWDYPMGSARRMGPGYFPIWLGVIMTGFGLIITVRSLWLKGEGISGWAFRPLLVLCAAIIAFGVLMEVVELGFVPSLFLLIIACALAHKDVHWGEMLLLGIFLTLGCVALFIYGIGLPYKLFWWN
jgi:hypothetical protein